MMRLKECISLLCIFLFVGSHYAEAQHPHPYFRNYNIDHGLPSPEVHYGLEDQQGMLWFATDNGVSRFDGYTFKNYGLEEGLSDLVVFHLQLDQQGRLWAATLSGKLFNLDNNLFEEYSENETIHKYNDDHGLITEFKIDQQDNIYLSIYPNGVLKFKKDKSHELFFAEDERAGHYAKYEEGLWLYGISNKLASSEVRKDVRMDFASRININGRVSEYPRNKLVGSTARNWIKGFENNRTFALLLPYLFELKEDKLVSQRELNYLFSKKSILETADGSLLIGLQKNQGLRHYHSMADWENEKYDLLLPGKSINHLFKDSRGNLWLSSLEHGIFVCPDPAAKIFDQSVGLSMSFVTSVALGDEDQVYFGLRDGNVYELNGKTNALRHLPMYEGEKIVYELEYDRNNEMLWAANGYIQFFQKGKWTAIINSKSVNNLKFNYGKTISLSEQKQKIWSGSIGGFGFIDSKKRQSIFSSNEYGLTERTLAIKETKNGKVWIGQPTGIYQFKNEKLERPIPFFEEFDARIDAIEELSDGTLVLGTKGKGLLLWKGEQLQKFLKTHGLSSNSIENIYVDEKDRIWVGTLSGLNVLTPKEDGQYQIDKYTTWHGLPSNHINGVQCRGDEIWIATAKGLINWNIPTKNTSVIPPSLASFKINGTIGARDSLGNLSHRQNNLLFEFFTLSYEQAGKIPYRYRLNEGAWIHSLERQATFTALAPGDYRFEVQAENEDAIWSESAVVDFTIRKPWWQRGWFFVLLALLLLAIASSYYRYQTQALRKEFEWKSQVNDLEKQALQAQMNPHFIFNCLNSIQLLIAKNQTDEAMRYLSRFAKLVRGTLDASLAGEVTLQEEIQLLQNYLDLEKLRFKEAMNYEIEVAPNIDKFEVSFPPMLLQPYVENALVHGMEGKDQGGFISIKFARQANQIIATICDNGPGWQAIKKNATLHDSVGMTLTARRLELLHGDQQMDFVKVEELKGAGESVAGTQVEVLIG